MARLWSAIPPDSAKHVNCRELEQRRLQRERQFEFGQSSIYGTPVPYNCKRFQLLYELIAQAAVGALPELEEDIVPILSRASQEL